MGNTSSSAIETRVEFFVPPSQLDEENQPAVRVLDSAYANDDDVENLSAPRDNPHMAENAVFVEISEKVKESLSNCCMEDQYFAPNDFPGVAVDESVLPSTTAEPISSPRKVYSLQPPVVTEEYSAYQHGAYSIKGRRPSNEDRHICEGAFNQEHGVGLYAVFDGHCGPNAAIYSSTEFPAILKAETELMSDVTESLKNAVRKLDESFLQEADEKELQDGTTAVVAYCTPAKIYVANLGDCRAVLATAGVAKELSRDHKPCHPEEKARISAMGGHVLFSCGCWRVMGELATSRAIGDRRLKPYVSSEAEVFEHDVTSEDEFLILACDGLWDVMSSQAVVNFVRRLRLRDASKICAALCRQAYTLGTLDNVTVVMVWINPPDWPVDSEDSYEMKDEESELLKDCHPKKSVLDDDDDDDILEEFRAQCKLEAEAQAALDAQQQSNATGSHASSSSHATSNSFSDVLAYLGVKEFS